MRRLPWTKFQDFYLQLGFLKVLVAVLSPQRRSEMNESIVRKLERPLFDPAAKHGALWKRVSDGLQHDASVAEALIVDGGCPSYLYAITGPTAYKILDWGRNVEFIGKGNQVSERGLLLRHLMDQDGLAKFVAGDVEAWNPFVLNRSERLFFLYHLAEIDEVILQLTRKLGELGSGTVLEF